MRSSWREVFNRFEEIFYRINLFVYLFRKEKVHQYFLIFVFLMLLSAFAFFIIEDENLSNATEGFSSFLSSRLRKQTYDNLLLINAFCGEDFS